MFSPLEWFRHSIFRQLNGWISLALLFILFSLGFVTYYNYYQLIQTREQELVDFRTEKVRDELLQTLEQFKRETVSLYNTNAINKEQGLNRYFLPPNIPDPDDADKQYEQLLDIRSYLTTVLNRNPSAVGLSFYRMTDNRTFQIGNLDPNHTGFDTSFFLNLPKTFKFPFIGKMNLKRVGSPEQSFLYMISPIFDIQAIKDSRVFGYFVMLFDPSMLYRHFEDEQGHAGGRLMVYYNNQLLLDSGANAAIPDISNRQNLLVNESPLQNYNLNIIGLKSKNEVRTTLNKIQITMISILLISWILCIYVISSIQRIMTKRMNRLVSHFKKFQMDPFVEKLYDNGRDEISFIVNRFNHLTMQLQEYIQRISTITLQKHNAEFYALKMQINPHFLYNTLESLRMQAIVLNQPSLGNQLYLLGQLFRWILKSKNDVIPISDEVQFIENYLELYNLGKSNKIELEIETELDLTQYGMLKFSFQPIIENAIQHGELDTMEEPLIKIHIYATSKDIEIALTNNGHILDPASIQQLQQDLGNPNDTFDYDHVGLKNVNERIRSFFGAEYGLKIMETDTTINFGLLMRFPLLTTVE